jgi:ubiquinone/menaquinone biosynthesis C-methylase UbiE
VPVIGTTSSGDPSVTTTIKKGMKALEAKSFAQEIAFGPFSFHATLALRDTGLLAALDDAGADGVDLDALVQATGVPRYGIEVLLDFGSNLDLVERRENRYSLGKVGHFVLHDEMTRVNMDFTRDVCYSALPELTTSILESRPAGLNALGPWSTIYQGLTVLPETARESWFRFDHYYSDRAFGALLPIVFRHGVRRLLDVGGNTGRWALRCLAHDPDVRVTLMDLPAQLEVARQNIEVAGFGDRADYHSADLLDDGTVFPEGADVIWMSQFLDCFSEQQIVGILSRAARAMSEESRLIVVELFPDRQPFPAARFSLDATSLYFTCIANGNSRMYRYDRFLRLVEEAGLRVVEEKDLPATGHTVLCCVRN